MMDRIVRFWQDWWVAFAAAALFLFGFVCLICGIIMLFWTQSYANSMFSFVGAFTWWYLLSRLIE